MVMWREGRPFQAAPIRLTARRESFTSTQLTPASLASCVQGISATTAHAPRRMASGMNSWPSARVPFRAM